MVIFITALVNSLKFLRKNWFLLPLMGILDIVFFFLSGSGLSFLNKLASPSVSELTKQIGQLGTSIAAAAAEGESALKVILTDPQVVLNLRSLVSVLLMFVGLLYVFWILFNGASWKLAHRMLGEKGGYIKFLTKFSVVTAIWFGIFLAILTAVIRFTITALLRTEPLATTQSIETFGLIINWIFFYFMFISMCIVSYTGIFENIKKTFKYGILKAPTFLITYAIILSVLYVNFQVTYFIFKPFGAESALTITSVLIILARFILAAPFLAWARMYLISVSKEAIKN